MKGMVFTSFLELVEDEWGLDMVDDLIASCDLPSGGAYTAVGTYDHAEMVALGRELERRSGIPLAELLKTFGRRLFHSLATAYPQLVRPAPDAFTFLEGVHGYIHVEVRKLYPDAELPSLTTRRTEDGSLEVDYRSSRHLEDLCEGLILGCMEHFDTAVTITRAPHDGAERFRIQPA